MTQGNGISIDPALQGESSHHAGSPASNSDLYGPQWALCVSTSRALGLEAGLFVRQLAHWLVEVETGGTFRDGRRWVWRTYEEWAEEFGWWNAQAIKRTIIPNIPEGVLLKKRVRDKGLLYSLDFPRIADLIEAGGEPLPKWLVDAIYDPKLSPGRQTSFPDDPRPTSGTDHDASPSLNNANLLVQVKTDLSKEVNSDLNEKVRSESFEKVKTDLNLTYRDNQQRKHTENKLASSSEHEVSERDNPWERTFGVDDEPQTFLERVWSLYCDNYDANETIELDDSRWRPLREGVIEWQREHRALVDPSQAEQVFDSITTRNPREPIGLIFSVFRDEIARREDLAAPYVPQVRQGSTRMAGRY